MKNTTKKSTLEKSYSFQAPKPFKRLHSEHSMRDDRRPDHKRREYDPSSPFPPNKKKYLGQHFLRKHSVVEHMIEKVTITPETSVLEIGCGDGFLTREIIAQTKCKQVLVYEIDQEWADFVRKEISDPRLKILCENVLDADFTTLQPNTPWVLLANLPYQITFPILFLITKNRLLFSEGVVMVQEEVAQKIVSGGGRGYNFTPLFLQHHFDWQLMEKIEPGAFSPPPKVFSRLLHFKPKIELAQIPDEEKFWNFIKSCFKSPRQNLRNNLRTTHLPWQTLDEKTGNLRAQQMSFNDFLQVWQFLNQDSK